MIVSKRGMVYHEIKKCILEGTFKNNSRITERALADKFNVTRVPVRESLVQLEQDGLIRKIPSKGYIVENYSAEEFEEALLMRFTIECEAASKAALNATAGDIIDLKNLNEAVKNAGHASNVEVVAELDREFHSRLIKTSKSKVLQKLYSIIAIPVFHYRMSDGISDAVDTFNGHIKIIEAIENRDSEEAFIRVFKHTPGRDNFKEKFYSAAAAEIAFEKKNGNKME